MILSDEKMSHLSHLISKDLKGNSGVRITTSDTELLKGIKKIVTAQLKAFSEIDQFARDRIKTYSRKIPEGSREWDVMYQKIVAEEAAKRSRRF